MGWAYNEQLLQVNSFFVVFIGSCKYEHVKKWLMFLTHFLKSFRSGFLRCSMCHSSGFACSALMIRHTGNSPLGLKNWNGICLFTSIRIDKEYSQLLNKYMPCCPNEGDYFVNAIEFSPKQY